MSFGGQVYNREAKDPSTMGCVWVCEKGTSQTLWMRETGRQFHRQNGLVIFLNTVESGPECLDSTSFSHIILYKSSQRK